MTYLKSYNSAAKIWTSRRFYWAVRMSVLLRDGEVEAGRGPRFSMTLKISYFNLKCPFPDIDMLKPLLLWVSLVYEQA